MNVTIERPNIVQLMYRQEKGDPDYGSCMWARFYLDLSNYTMSIEGDCGNYTHGWVPTPDSETFLQLLTRMDKGYLLYKISNETVINWDKTWEQVRELVREVSEDYDVTVDADTWEELEEACYSSSDERDIVHAVLDTGIPGEVYSYLNGDGECYLYGCVVKDYPTNAKKIVQVFNDCIRPKIKELVEEAKNDSAV